jgi:hypothetical protein
MNCSKICRTVAAAGSSTASACIRLPSTALAGLGAGLRDQPVSIRRPAAEEAAFELGLRCHGGADADLDAVPLALRDPAEHGHDQVVGLVVWVDRAADLGHPERHAVVGEDREGVAELVAVERSLRLPHDDSLESVLFYVLIRNAGAIRANLGRLSRPVFTVAYGNVFLGETIQVKATMNACKSHCRSIDR